MATHPITKGQVYKYFRTGDTYVIMNQPRVDNGDNASISNYDSDYICYQRVKDAEIFIQHRKKFEDVLEIDGQMVERFKLV